MDPDALPGFGHGPFTRQKYADFADLLAQHTAICKNIFARWPQRRYPYLYLDLNAGPGLWSPPDDPDVLVQGTPLLATGRLHRLAGAGPFPYHAYLIEQEPSTVAFLRLALDLAAEFDEATPARITVAQADHALYAPGVLRRWGEWLAQRRVSRVYGLLFHDPTGLPDFALLRRLAALPAAERLDLLVYLQATALKRNLNRAGDPDRGVPLRARLGRIDKKCWLVREPDGHHQFAFLLGSNWVDYPAWKKKRFHRVDTPEGEDILERLSFDREEYEARKRARAASPLAALALTHADGERWGQPVDPAVEDEDD